MYIFFNWKIEHNMRAYKPRKTRIKCMYVLYLSNLRVLLPVIFNSLKTLDYVGFVRQPFT